MRLSTVLLSLISIVSAAPSSAKTPSTFAQREVLTPPADSANWTDPKVLYARSAQLKDGSLIATWENYSPEPPQVYFPIFHSADGGYTWSERSRVQDTVNGWGLRYQPFLYVLEKPFAGYKSGTVFLAGSSIPTDLSVTQIDLYASTDAGKTWAPLPGQGYHTFGFVPGKMVGWGAGSGGRVGRLKLPPAGAGATATASR